MILIGSSIVNMDQTYLGTDNLPLAPLVILGRHSQGVNILLLPNAETLTQTLVLHLQAGGGVDDVFAFGKAGGNVFPGECLGLAKLDEETVVVGESVGCC
jgi:hypothetical protein